MRPVTFGCVGLGGYGKIVVDLLLQHPTSRLVAVCEPEVEMHPELVEQLRHRGVRIYRKMHDLLSDDCEAVWLPLPIGLHRIFSEQALAAGKAVLCEKPAAGCVADVDAMIAARAAARLPLEIAFQDLFDPGVLEIKQHLLDGRIGRLKEVSLLAASPRGDDYYARPWAGRQRHAGNAVMDSPPMNALAHGLALAMFLAGGELNKATGFSKVEAELFRARPIENFDTAAIRAVFDEQVAFRGYFTHACRENLGTSLRLVGEAGELVIAPLSCARFTTSSGTLTLTRDAGNSAHALAGFAASLRGVRLPIDTLAVARGHVTLLEAAAASPVVDVPPEFIDCTAAPGLAIRGIEAALVQCERDGAWLAASPLCPWVQQLQEVR